MSPETLIASCGFRAYLGFIDQVWFFFVFFGNLVWFRFIDEDDLLRFMIKEEVDLVLPLFGTDNGRIDRKALTDWVVSESALLFSLAWLTI